MVYNPTYHDIMATCDVLHSGLAAAAVTQLLMMCVYMFVIMKTEVMRESTLDGKAAADGLGLSLFSMASPGP